MRLLLDTNIFIAILLQDTGHLPQRVERSLAEKSDRFISAATLWEMAIKYRLGKLDFGMSLDALPDMIRRSGMTIVPITEHHALHDVRPEPPTRDPFDRLLLAQCAIEGMRLVTIDRALVDHPLSLTASP